MELLGNAVASSLPYALSKYRSVALRRELRELDASGRFDLIICDFLTPAFDVTRSVDQTPAILFQHNIEANIWERLSSNEQRPPIKAYFANQAGRMAAWENRLSRGFDGVITVSPEDSRHATEIYGLDNVLGDVPTGVDADEFGEVASSRAQHTPGHHLIFLGSMDWLPNIEAVQWFATQILPLIRSDLPDLKFTIIGRNPSPSIRDLAQPGTGIHVTGTVPDVRPFLVEGDVMVVPLKSGGGTRIKILEAMAAEIPIVSTSVGAEGLGLTSGEELVLADTAAEFARQTLRLLTQPKEASELARRARERVITHNGWGAVTDHFLDLCAMVLDRETNRTDLRR
jgi:glycosyltransferase involved in cell wall biosynthesis